MKIRLKRKKLKKTQYLFFCSTIINNSYYLDKNKGLY